jgi:hypothetical protein
VPAAEIESDYSDKALYGVLDLGHGKECVWMCHEAVSARQLSDASRKLQVQYNTLCNPFQHRPRLKNEGGESDPTEIRARPKL